jgi:SNF2 family DNA or RNA helicase
MEAIPEYAHPIQVFNDEQITAKFRKTTAPFMMQRMKSDKTIISDLPDKIEQN